MSELAEILEDLDLCDYLECEGIEYKKSGPNNIKLKECPWCGGSKAYFSVTKKVGNCFSASCNEKFNLFTFAKQTLSTTNFETFKHFKNYSDNFGYNSSSTLMSVETTPLEPLTSGWKLPNSVSLPTPSGHTHSALTARSISLETQAKFGLRWCEKGSFNYYDEFYGSKFQNFSQRIIIPVYDLNDELVTFQGRAAWNVNEESGEKRYLFPAGLPGTGKFIYNGNKVKSLETLIMGEGPFDAMAIDQLISNDIDFKGYGAIASFGLNIGHGDENHDDQLGRLRTLKSQGLKTIIICWDGEHNAFMQALEAAKFLNEERFNVKVVTLPQGTDPNEVTSIVLKKCIEEAWKFNYPEYISLKICSKYNP